MQNHPGRMPEQGSLTRQYPGVAENYTKPFLVTFAFWIFCMLTVIWAVWGFLLALGVSVFANQLIAWGAARRAARGIRPGTGQPPRR